MNIIDKIDKTLNEQRVDMRYMLKFAQDNMDIIYKYNLISLLEKLYESILMNKIPIDTGRSVMDKTTHYVPREFPKTKIKKDLPYDEIVKIIKSLKIDNS